MKKNDLALIKWIDEFSKYGYIVSIRQKSSVDSVQRFLLYFILFTKKEI